MTPPPEAAQPVDFGKTATQLVWDEKSSHHRLDEIQRIHLCPVSSDLCLGLEPRTPRALITNKPIITLMMSVFIISPVTASRDFGYYKGSRRIAPPASRLATAGLREPPQRPAFSRFLPLAASCPCPNAWMKLRASPQGVVKLVS